MTQTHTITVEPLGREVQCREDQSILDACLRAGVWLPHSCTHGTCATCKADVVDGEVDHGAASSFALMDYERDEGKLLPCVACPRSDVVIEADIDVDESMPVHPVQDFTGTVVALEEIALQTRRLVVELDSTQSRSQCPDPRLFLGLAEERQALVDALFDMRREGGQT